MDGNNSLKRLGLAVKNQNERHDSRTLISDRWITAEEVDIFKDAVKSRSVRSFVPECAIRLTAFSLLGQPKNG